MAQPKLSAKCLQQFPWPKIPGNARKAAGLLRESRIHGRQIPLFSENNPTFDQKSAYEISAASCATTIRYGNNVVGRKIGFTNTKIWSDYNVSEPNWGYLYEKRTLDALKLRGGLWLSKQTINLQPRIEPEIVFRLRKIPHSSMTEREALSCVLWIAHGFEVVTSLFKDWKFTAADTTATNALHNSLYIGAKRVITKNDLDALPAQLENFEIKLYRNKELVDTGLGSNVLGSPIKALLHLCSMLENQDLHPGLSVGEIITTGTLTKAIPMNVNETWSTAITGIDLRGLELKTSPMPDSVKVAEVVNGVDSKRLDLNTQSEPASEKQAKLTVRKKNFKRLVLNP